jgi:hypothetical protein
MDVANLQGPVNIFPSDDPSLVRVSIRKSSVTSPLNSVSVHMYEFNGNLYFCSLYPDVPGETPNSCAPDTYTMSSGDNDVLVSYDIYIPNDMFSWVETVSGNIQITDVQQLAVGISVSGSILIDTLEVGIAESVSGSLDISWDPSTIEYYDFEDPSISFSTTSGDIKLTIPSSSEINFYADTLSGEIRSDFNLPGQGETTREGMINGGGYLISAETVSGDIELNRK